MSSTYSIAITGVRAGVAKEAAIKQLAELLKVAEERVASMLDSQKFTVKSGIDLKTAARYETAIRSCGCACIVEPNVTVTEDLIFDVSENFKQEPNHDNNLTPANQERQPVVELNPNIFKFIKSGTTFSNLVGWGVAAFVGLVLFNWVSGLSFFGGGNVALASGVIKQSLRSPSSFSLVSGREMWKGKNAEGKSAHIVEIEYDAQNGFGASLRDCKIVSFYKDGDSVKWSLLWGAMPCASNSAHGGLLEDSKVVEIVRKNNSFQ